MSYKKNIKKDIRDLYEIHDFKHASTILARDCKHEFDEICDVLRKFRFHKEDIIKGGGNESHIPKIFSTILRPMGWNERNLKAELKVYEVKDKNEVLKNSVNHGSHKVDYIKNRVAFDLEWNSKDQTFDRDLYAFRAFFEYDAISVGIIVTRGISMNALFKELHIISKYGASTTHIDKLIPRLKAGRNGGCPILVFGITPKLLTI